MVDTNPGLADGTLLLWLAFEPTDRDRRDALAAARRVNDRAYNIDGLGVDVDLVDSWMVAELGAVGVRLSEIDDVAEQVRQLATDEGFDIRKMWIAAGKERLMRP